MCRLVIFYIKKSISRNEKVYFKIRNIFKLIFINYFNDDKINIEVQIFKNFKF